MNYVVAISTIALAIVTFLYLQETKRMRNIANDSLRIEAAPKLFIQSIATHRNFVKQTKKLFVYATVLINNVGKTEAKAINVFYEIKIGGNLQIPKQVQTAPYIFPSQIVAISTQPVFFELSDEEVHIVEEQLEKQTKILFPRPSKPKFFIQIKIEYIGFKGEPGAVSYLCEYDWECGDWAMSIPPVPGAKA